MRKYLLSLILSFEFSLTRIFYFLLEIVPVFHNTIFVESCVMIKHIFKILQSIFDGLLSCNKSELKTDMTEYFFELFYDKLENSSTKPIFHPSLLKQIFEQKVFCLLIP